MPPFVDLRLLRDKILLPSYIILITTGITMFMIIQQQASWLGVRFRWDLEAIHDAANVQRPFMISFLVFGGITPFIIKQIGSIKPVIIGGIISLFGTIGLLVFNSTEFIVSVNLAIIATGLSLTMTATWNMIVSSSPNEFTGISVGVGVLLLFVGMAIGPALAGIYMADYETMGVRGLYPSDESYDLVFLTSGIASAVSLGFGLILQEERRYILWFKHQDPESHIPNFFRNILKHNNKTVIVFMS